MVRADGHRVHPMTRLRHGGPKYSEKKYMAFGRYLGWRSKYANRAGIFRYTLLQQMRGEELSKL